MPAWGWALIAIGGVAALVAAAAAARSRRRSASLRGRFGPEYDRALERHESRRAAETDLEGRVERREQLEIVPLSLRERERYLAEWRQVQERFVDRPEGAVAEAQALVRDVMAARGYPMESFERRVDDLSVDHPLVVEHYRAAQAIAARSARGEADTEELRRGFQHYRALFDDLLETPADEPLAAERHAPTEVDADAHASDGREVRR